MAKKSGSNPGRKPPIREPPTTNSGTPAKHGRSSPEQQQPMTPTQDYQETRLRSKRSSMSDVRSSSMSPATMPRIVTVDTSPTISPARSHVTNSMASLAPATAQQRTSWLMKKWDKNRRKMLGSLFMLICIMVYVIQSEVVQYVQSVVEFHSPFFFLWFSHSFFVLMLPVQLASDWFDRHQGHVLGVVRRLIRFGPRYARLGADAPGHVEDRRAVSATSSRSTSPSRIPPIRRVYWRSSGDASSPTIWKAYVDKVERVSGKTFTDFMLFCLAFSIFFTLPNYLWYVALDMTTVAELTAIYNTACFFAYVFSVMLLGESICLLKVAAVVFSVAGVSLIALLDHGEKAANINGKNRVFGDFVALLAAILLGLYEVCYKKYASVESEKAIPYTMGMPADIGHPGPLSPAARRRLAAYTRLSEHIQDDERRGLRPSGPLDANDLHRNHYGEESLHSVPLHADTACNMPALPLPSQQKAAQDNVKQNAIYLANQVTAFIGVFTLVAQWVAIPLLHWIGAEPFALPKGGIMGWFLLCVNGLLATVYNALFMIVIALTSPLFASVGIMITIPVSAYVDYFVTGKLFGLVGFIGSGMICVGFALLVLAGEEGDEDGRAEMHDVETDRINEGEGPGITVNTSEN